MCEDNEWDEKKKEKKEEDRKMKIATSSVNQANEMPAYQHTTQIANRRVLF